MFNKAEVDVFLELSCFFNDPTDVGYLISGSSAFSKSSLFIWKFSVHCWSTVEAWRILSITLLAYEMSTIVLVSHASKVMLKILQARLQQYMDHELPDVQAGFRKDRGTRDQIANICWIIEKAREFQKNIYFCSIDYTKVFDSVDHNKLENSERDGNTKPPYLPPEKSLCRSRNNN